ncbi:hypothetical protein [Bradyrhizobium canariense]|uniref:hypothetical protein n=2 Tax=Bradyrhizobium TaxID=374 RepID=UPI0019589C55|nr:hypothetical protein [Bradyrhizobium canariense]MBM7487338.1 hypothetical protein [Bradyrhizobium canariense]
MLKRVEQRRERAAVGGPHDGVGGRHRIVERTDRIIRLGQVEAPADLLAGLVDVVLVVECRLERIRRPPHLMEVTADLPRAFDAANGEPGLLFGCEGDIEAAEPGDDLAVSFENLRGEGHRQGSFRRFAHFVAPRKRRVHVREIAGKLRR